MSTFDLAQLSDDDLRAALFDALVERLDEKVLEDPSIAVVNRMPAAFAVSRRGNLLTLTQGIGLRLLRGDLKWKDRREKPRTFSVDRATIQSRLAIMPDRIEGTPDELLDRIVVMFLEWTATGEEESRPAATEPVQESRPAVRESMQERHATSAGSAQERQPAAPRTVHESRPAPVGVTDEHQPAPQTANRPSEADAAPPRPAPVR